MKKITLRCKLDGSVDDCRESVYLHGWLMNHLDEKFATELHQTGMNPLSLQVAHDGESVSFIINLLTGKACSEIEPLIMDDSLDRIYINGGSQHEFEIAEKSVAEMNESGLSRIFYGSDCSNVFKLKVMTPMAFKTHGTYMFLPDIRLLFQNLMNDNYLSPIEGDENALNQKCNAIKLEIITYLRLKETKTKPVLSLTSSFFH